MAWTVVTTQPNDARRQFPLASVSKMCHSAFQNMDTPRDFGSCRSLRHSPRNITVLLLFRTVMVFMYQQTLFHLDFTLAFFFFRRTFMYVIWILQSFLHTESNLKKNISIWSYHILAWNPPSTSCCHQNKCQIPSRGWEVPVGADPCLPPYSISCFLSCSHFGFSPLSGIHFCFKVFALVVVWS